MEQRRNHFAAVFLMGILCFSLLSVPTVQADGPTNVQFVGINALTYSGADDTGLLTANATVRQGDYLHLEIPVENIGNDLQVASIFVNVSQSGWNETAYFENISIDAMTTQVLLYLSSHQLTEGTLGVEMSIVNTSIALTDSIEIGPPPLPEVFVEIESITPSYSAGDSIEFNLTASNTNGERAFSGNIVCAFLDEEIYNQSLEVDVGGEVVSTLALYARPGVLECHLSGDRNQSTQTTTMYSLESLESAVFDEAGSSGFSFIGGPWHAGDDMEVSFILRNQGDAAGTAQLKVMDDGSEYLSNILSLDPGSAGELRILLEDMTAGTHNFTWMIVSTDGLVSSGLEGVATTTVDPPQAMFAEVEVEVNQASVQLNWNASITDGVNRDVKLRYGYRVSGTDVFVNEQIITLGSGTLSGQTTLGEIQSDTVVVRMEPLGWDASTNSYIATASIETTEASYSLQIDPITLPREPVEGKEVTVTIMLQNTGTVEGPEGILYLTDSSGYIFGQFTTEPLQATSSRNIDATFVVPSGNEIILNAEWRYGSSVVEDEQNILVSAKEIEQDSTEIPFVAIGGGIAVACCFILVLHLRRGASTEAGSTKPVKEKKQQAQPAKKEVEPVEKSCPACERTLRIPGDYSGTVRCPDCSEKFEVEAEESFDFEDELDSIEDVKTEEKAVEKKIEIGCPECSSKLRVPSTYKGSVRCPSCSNVFSAG